MKFHAALLLLMSLAAASAHDNTPAPTSHTPAPTSHTPAPTSHTPAPTTKPGSSPTPKPTSTGGGKGDPVMTDFSGRTFEFFGKAGSTYNVISEKNHQLSMKLKEGKMWDHQGTYMSALGFKYQEHTVEIQNEGDALTVLLDGEAITLRKDQTESEHILGMVEGEMSLLWQLHRAELGNAVEITTDLLNIVAWVTPAGTRDEGGKVQPAYLNFDVSLLASPAHNAMEGIVGKTFAATSTEENDFKFHGEEAEYEMASFFEAAHPKSLYGKAKGGSLSRSRKLIETGATILYPMRAAFASK